MGALANAIDELDALDALDPDALTDDELHALVVATRRERDRLVAAEARLVAAWDARRCWADDGSKAAAARLARECSLSGITARAELKRARKLRSMLATADALREGKVSVDQADLLAFVNQPEVAEQFARDEAMLIGEVCGLRFFHALRAVRYWLQLAEDEAGKEPSSCCRDGRRLSAVRMIHGTVEVQGSLDAIGGTELLDELGRLERRRSRPTGPRPATASATKPAPTSWRGPRPSAGPTPWSRWRGGRAPRQPTASGPGR
jgi:hypothetical protein